MEKMRWIKKGISVLLALNMVLSSVPLPAFAAAEDNLCEHHPVHTAECHYAEGSPGSACTHEHSEDCYKIVECLHTCGDECANGCGHSCTVENGCITMEADCHHTHGDCGYAPATEGTPCNHVCEVKVNSADSCYKLLCSHKDGGHDNACGYAASVEAHECHYECAECAAALTSEEETDPTTQPTTEPTTAPTTESAPVCTCESDDPDWHAPFCDLYVVPENPRCYCVEKCGDGAFNEWCEVCYFDPDACWASGEEEAVVYPSTPTYIASIGIAQDASSGSTGVNILCIGCQNRVDLCLDFGFDCGCTDFNTLVIAEGNIFIVVVVKELVASAAGCHHAYGQSTDKKSKKFFHDRFLSWIGVRRSHASAHRNSIGIV